MLNLLPCQAKLGIALLAMCHVCVAQEVVARANDGIVIIPWIEVNSLDLRRIDHAVEGLLVWKHVTDTAIVSTIPGLAEIYVRIGRRLPDMRIIPGIKTNDALERFDSVRGWETIAQEVRAVCNSSGEKIVVLENESASRKYFNGEYEIDLDRLREGLRQLPKDIEVIWYPSLTGATERQRQRCEGVCRVVAEVLDVTFVDLSMSRPAGLRHRWSQRGEGRLKRIAKTPTIPLLYCYGPGTRWWMDDEIPKALEHVQGGRAILYPGGKRWPQAARSITELLADSLRPVRPRADR